MGFKMNPGDALKKLNTEGTFSAKQVDTMSKMNFDVISPINSNHPDREGATKNASFRYNEEGRPISIITSYGSEGLVPSQASIDAARAGTGAFDPTATSAGKYKGKMFIEDGIISGVYDQEGKYTKLQRPYAIDDSAVDKDPAFIKFMQEKSDYETKQKDLEKFRQNLIAYGDRGGVTQNKKI